MDNIVGSHKSGYKMIARSAKRGEAFIYGVIGLDLGFGVDGVTAKQFATDLKKLGPVDTIDVFINSDGGIVDDARAIYTQLTQHPATINVQIDSIAASAASFIAMAGKTISIAEGGFIMIHEARGGFRGTAEGMRKHADLMDSYTNSIAQTYIARTKKPESQIRDWMRAETYFTGAEAVQIGFADRTIQNMRVAACLGNPFGPTNIPAVLRPNRAAAVAALETMKAPLR